MAADPNITTKVHSARDVKWRSAKHSYITFSQVPSGEWTLYTNGASVKPQDLREMADALEAAAREVPKT